MLSSSDYGNLLEIGTLLETIDHPTSNPPEFWKNIADLAKGKRISSSSCTLGNRHSIAIRQDLKICYWLDNSSFGKTDMSLEPSQVQAVKRNFEINKLSCKVGFQCFCTQDISHVWNTWPGASLI